MCPSTEEQTCSNNKGDVFRRNSPDDNSDDDDAIDDTTHSKISQISGARQSDLEGPLIQFMTGIVEDLKDRLPWYKDDWSRPKNFFTVLNATVFAFVIQLIPALIFAELMDRETEGNLATAGKCNQTPLLL